MGEGGGGGVRGGRGVVFFYTSKDLATRSNSSWVLLRLFGIGFGGKKLANFGSDSLFVIVYVLFVLWDLPILFKTPGFAVEER